MPPTIYVETSIPSFYFDTRRSVAIRVRRDWTREWWKSFSTTHELVTAPPVIAELHRTPSPKREQMIEFMEPIRRLKTAPKIDAIIAFYLTNQLMPREASEDAAHLAFASFYGCGWLLTWNCKHLANGNKIGHIRVVNRRLGLETPELITPLQMLDQ